MSVKLKSISINMKNTKNEKRFVIFCGVKGCCPSVEFKKDRVLIKDDYGGKVRLSRDRWQALVGKMQKGELIDRNIRWY
jgi:hypothetical protein